METLKCARFECWRELSKCTYVHYNGSNKEDDEWVDLTPERVRPRQDDKDVAHNAAAQGTRLTLPVQKYKY